MKIINVIGSPRSSGNSATVAQMLLEKLPVEKAQVRTFQLNRLNYRGCQGCMACKTKFDHCVAKDDLTEVLEEIRIADVVVIGTSVYIGEINAQTKGLCDRFYSYYLPDYLTNPRPGRLAPGKKLVFILSQGNPDPNAYKDLVAKYTGFFDRLGFTNVYTIRVLGAMPFSDVRIAESVLQSINDTAHQIFVGV
ncbi:MAG TPA: NADPH-dependent FMN reductase [Firmicutes bacterium]|jgi:multimeric flavodoxin WrbA|nr:NADPH-dependent FMN reductase [Bacillota bacterium]